MGRIKLASAIGMLFLAACNNYDLAGKLSCPECAVSGTAVKNPGTTYQPCTACRIFVSGTTQGNMSGATGGGSAVAGVGASGVQKADHICQNDANRPDITRTWKALVTDPANRLACTNADCGGGTGGRIDWILKPATNYFRANGATPIFTTNANAVFVFGTMTNAIDMTIAYNVWTGLNADWTTGGNHCTNWSDPGGGVNGAHGISSLGDGQGISGVNQTCNTLLNLYCVEQ